MCLLQCLAPNTCLTPRLPSPTTVPGPSWQRGLTTSRQVQDTARGCPAAEASGFAFLSIPPLACPSLRLSWVVLPHASGPLHLPLPAQAPSLPHLLQIFAEMSLSLLEVSLPLFQWQPLLPCSSSSSPITLLHLPYAIHLRYEEPSTQVRG